MSSPAAIIDSTNAKAASDKEIAELREQGAVKDRENKIAIQNIALQIAEMELAGQQNISLTQVKAMLAQESPEGEDALIAPLRLPRLRRVVTD